MNVNIHVAVAVCVCVCVCAGESEYNVCMCKCESVSGNMAKKHNDTFYYLVQYDLNTHHVVLVFLLARAPECLTCPIPCDMR